MSRILAVICLSAAMLGSSAPQSETLLHPDEARFKQPAPDVCTVRLDTNKGLIDIRVTRAWSPLGADRFVSLARAGYYDQTRFFRVTPGKWAQFGINGTPAVAKAWRNQTIADDPFRESNVQGTVAFAFAVPNGRTTQVFINLQDNSATHDKEPFTPFGRIVEGLNVATGLNDEYQEGPGGIRAGHQDPYFDGGNAWLLKQFPRLDYIRTATVR
jgi:peptidyl-prolyl cis-trans isomerase A (cyclophilin A)